MQARYILYSLPLMGIGNLADAVLLYILERISLPLMGIGNALRTLDPYQRLAAPHYPSWGSETGLRPVC